MKIEQVFKDHFGNEKFDKKLVDKLIMFQKRWVSRGDHSLFLSQPYINTVSVIFTVEDDQMLMQEILGLSTRDIKIDLHKCDDIFPEREVTSNPVLLTMMWLTHMFVKNKLDDGVRVMNALFSFKVLGSILYRNFNKFKGSETVAEAVHHNLPAGYLIKRYGTWGKVIMHRSTWMLDGGHHYKRLMKGTAEDLTYVIVDMRGAFSSTIRNHTDAIMKVMESGTKSHISSMVEGDGEGEERFAEMFESPAKYGNNIKQIIYSKHDFLKPALVDVLLDLIPNADIRGLNQTLEYMSTDYIGNKTEIDFIVDTVTIEFIEYLAKSKIEPSEILRRIVTVMDMLKGKVMTPKGQGENMYNAKENMFAIVEKATNKRTKAYVNVLVNAAILYTFLRGIVGRNI